jgi:hypothetical protein
MASKPRVVVLVPMLYFFVDSLFIYFPRLSKRCEASSQRERFERLAQDFTTDPIDDKVAFIRAWFAV